MKFWISKSDMAQPVHSTRLPWRVRKKLFARAASQLDNGRSLTEVLVDFRDSLQRRGQSSYRLASHEIWRRVVDGQSLASAMSESVTHLERSIIAAGEQAGKLSKAMRLVIELRDLVSRLRWQLLQSTASPLVYLCTIYGALYVIGSQLVPQFASVIPTSKWTGWAYSLYLLGNFATGWIAPLAIGATVAMVIWIIWALPRWMGRPRSIFDRYVFPFTIYRELTGMAWLFSFVALLNGKIAEVDALSNQISTASPWLASRLRPIHAGVKNGLNLAAAMRLSGYDFPSVDLIDEIGAYVNYKDFSDRLESVTKDYVSSFESRLMIQSFLGGIAFSALMYSLIFVVTLGANGLSNLLSSPSSWMHL